MKRETLIKYWKIVEAFRNGKKVQYKNSDGAWVDTDHPSFIDAYEYRIKPERKTGWVNIYGDSAVAAGIYQRKIDADENADGKRRVACIQISYEEGEGL